jgi:putative inorganic carbon (HCO3(-)) transporter
VIFYRPYLSVVFVIVSIPFEGVIDFRFISRFLGRVTGIDYKTIYYLEDITIYPLEAILAVSVLICIYKSILGRDSCFRNMKLVYCYIPFVLCIMLSATKSIELSLTAKEIMRWLELIVIYYLTINLINDDKKMRVVLYSMFSTVAMVSVFGIINFNYMDDTYRATSIFGNPNPLAGYVNLIIPVSFGMLISSVCLWERIKLGIFTVLSIIVWVLTFSRAGWLSLIMIMILVFSLIKVEMKRVTLVLVVFLAISAILFLSSNTILRGKFIGTTTLNAVKTALEPRALCYPIGLNMVKDDVILGIGIGNYPLLIKKYTNVYELTHYSQVYTLTRHHLHNLYLQIFVETGIMGLSAFVFWLVCIVKYLVRSLKSLENSRHYLLFVGLMGGVIVYLFNNLADVLTVHGIHLQWGIILGLAVVLIQFRESETCLKTV